MTRVRMEKRGKDYRVKLDGHAAGAPDVCAAISCLVYTAAGWLRNTERAEGLKETLESGEAELKWYGGDDARVLWEFLQIGFLQLETTAPEYIKVTVGND